MIFLLCLVVSVTAYGQCSIHGENCIHYSERQDINCLRCFEHEIINDSIIKECNEVISMQKIAIESFNNNLELMALEVAKAEAATERQKVKKKRVFIWAGSATLLAIIEGLIIWLL